jgi:HK97 family phage prohead protease
MGADYTFSGWATKNDLRCSDGRTIRRNAFRDQDGTRVSLVWNHKHDEPENVIGHADLENRDDGVYAYCTLNDTPKARNVKALIEHGDIASLSIYANQLKQVGSDVLHGTIREVSVVLAGANPGAVIEAVLEHSGEESTEEAIIYSGDCDIEIVHADKSEEENTIEHSDGNKEENMADNTNEKTVGDVVNSMTEEQKNVMYALIAEALEEKGSDEEDNDVKHNVFENDVPEETLSHDAMMEVITDAKRYGSMKESALQHGINDVEYLYPEDHVLNTPPAFIKRDTGWVGTVMNGVKHTPFSRIKSMFADLTEDEARAKGYIKGKMKKEEFFGLLKRSTAPTTVYKKQKMDRDDVVDITDFDVIAWLKGEMRVMLDEEIARAVLIGDGRLASSDDKIPEDHIRPIWKDEALFTIKTNVTYAENATDDQKAKAFIRAAVKARKDYKGSGNPTLFTTEDVLTDLLLLEDLNGRVIYESVDKLATALRVSKIVTVPVMENQTREDSETSKTMKLLGLIVNLADYTIGADKGGAVNMFDDFDIDYNQQKYLIETRCSGALIVPYSAIALETEVTE